MSTKKSHRVTAMLQMRASELNWIVVWCGPEANFNNAREEGRLLHKLKTNKKNKQFERMHLRAHDHRLLWSRALNYHAIPVDIVAVSQRWN